MDNLKPFKYYAFISYSHKDSDWAKWLQHELEYYQLPSTLNGRKGLPTSFRPIFRDEDELSGGDLKPQISSALASSEFLIVICSPNSAKSEYVNNEIMEFIEIGRNRNEDYTKRIFPLIVEGKPHQEKGSPIECFPPIINNLKDLSGDDVELIAGDITATGRNHAFVKILAGTLKEKNIQFSELWNRYEEYKLEQEKKEKKEKNRLLLMESHLIAEKSFDLIAKGDSYLAQLLLLSVIPSVNNLDSRPYCAEVESALRKAYIHKSTIMRSNGSWIKRLKYSPNGKYIAVYDESETITIWNTNNGVQILKFNEVGSFNSVDFSPNSELFVLSNFQFDIEFYDLSTCKKCPFIFQGHTDKINSISFSPDGTKLVSTSKDKTILVWNFKDKCKSMTIKWRGIYFEQAKYTHDSKRIITVSKGSSIVIWDTETGSMLSPKMKGHRYTIYGFSISSSDKFLLTWGGEGSAILWDLATYQQCFKIKNINQFVGALFTPDEQKILTAHGTSFKIWETTNGTQFRNSIEVHNSHITTMDINQDGTYIITGDSSGFIHLWYTDFNNDLPESFRRKKDLEFHDHTNSINHLKFNPVDKTFCSGSHDRTVRMRDYLNETKASNVKRFWKKIASAVAYDSNNNIIAASDDKYSICLYNSLDGKLLKEWDTLHTDRIRHIAFNSNSSVIATVSHDKSIYLWNISTGEKMLGPLLGHSKWVVMGVFSPDDKILATASSDGEIRLWDVELGKCIYKFDADYENMSNALSFDSTGKILAYGSNKNVKIMDICSKRDIITLNGHTDFITDLAFSPDNRYLATASSDLSVRLWDVMTGKQIGNTMNGHGSLIESIRFNHEGSKLVSADSEGKIIIWDIRSTIPLGYPLDGLGRAYHAEFSLDDSLIYVYGFDHHFFEYKHFYDLVAQSSAALTGRKLTNEEKSTYHLL